MIISLTPVITAIFNPQSFGLVALGMPVMIIFVIAPYFTIYSIKYILGTVGVYGNIIELKIAECPENSEVTKTEKNVSDDIKEGIMLLLCAIIKILLIILVAEIIYYNVPIWGPVGP